MAILPLQLARVSNLLRANLGTSNINRTQQQLLEVQNQLSTGERLNLPSDDPGDSAIVQQLQKLLEQRKAEEDARRKAAAELRAKVDALKPGQATAVGGAAMKLAMEAAAKQAAAEAARKAAAAQSDIGM